MKTNLFNKILFVVKLIVKSVFFENDLDLCKNNVIHGFWILKNIIST